MCIQIQQHAKLSRDFSRRWRYGDTLRFLGGHGGVFPWPGQCFFPKFACVSSTFEIISRRTLDREYVHKGNQLAILGPWRSMRGNSCFSAALPVLFSETSFKGNFTANNLYQPQTWRLGIERLCSFITSKFLFFFPLY